MPSVAARLLLLLFQLLGTLAFLRPMLIFGLPIRAQPRRGLGQNGPVDPLSRTPQPIRKARRGFAVRCRRRRCCPIGPVPLFLLLPRGPYVPRQRGPFPEPRHLRADLPTAAHVQVVEQDNGSTFCAIWIKRPT